MADSVDGAVTGGPEDADVVPVPEASPKRRSRALALWGVLAVLAVGAGALVVSSADDDPPKLPVALGAPGGARAESLASPAADMSMMAWVRYVAGDDLPRLGGEGPAYKISGDVDEDRVRDLAEVLGIEGAEVTRRDQAWIVDGDGGHLEVYEGSGASWWYSPEDPNATTGGGVAGSSGSAGITEEEAKRLDETAAREAEAAAREGSSTTLAVPPDCPPDADCAFPAPEPITPPADLPSEAEARQLVLDLFADAGLDTEGAKVTVDGPYDAWFVTVEPRVDGRIVAGLGWSASVGSKGEITSASGSLNRPERLGDYPVLDTHAAIDRLNAQAGSFETLEHTAVAPEESTTSMAPPECAAATDLPTPTTQVLSDPDAPVASDDVLVDPAIGSCEPSVPTEPMEIVLHEAEPTLVLVGSFDGTDSYLVPGYRMRGDDGAEVEVAAVDDDSLLPQPEPVEPQVEPGIEPGDGPDTTIPGDTRCATPEPGPDGAVPEICLDPNSTPPSEGIGGTAPAEAPPG